MKTSPSVYLMMKICESKCRLAFLCFLHTLSRLPPRQEKSKTFLLLASQIGFSTLSVMKTKYIRKAEEIITKWEGEMKENTLVLLSIELIIWNSISIVKNALNLCFIYQEERKETHIITKPFVIFYLFSNHIDCKFLIK
jgi:hypothetical protein